MKYKKIIIKNVPELYVLDCNKEKNNSYLEFISELKNDVQRLFKFNKERVEP